MARSSDWPTLRADLEARGYDLDTDGMFAPANDPADEEAWDAWSRLSPALGGASADATWATVAPHLPEIEAALAGRTDLRPESWTIRHPDAIRPLKNAARGLAGGVAGAEESEEALRRLDLAARAARQIASGPTMIAALLGVSTFRDVLGAAGTLIERRLPPEANARIRAIVDPLVLRPWREVVLGELRFSLGYLDALLAGEIPAAGLQEERRIAGMLARPGALDRARTMIASRLAPALDLAEEEDDLALFGRIAPSLEPSPWARLSPDALTRGMARTMGIWPQLPRLYRSLTGHRRMVRLAATAADLPPGTPFAQVERLRLSLGAEGWDPSPRDPIRIADEGTAWAFHADAVREVAIVRIPRK